MNHFYYPYTHLHTLNSAPCMLGHCPPVCRVLMLHTYNSRSQMAQKFASQ